MKNINDAISPDAHGVWIDGSHTSADELSYRIIKFAVEHGYDVDMEQIENDLANYDNMLYEEQGDVSQALWEESECAIDYLNNTIDDKSYYFYIDDACLYLEWSDESGTEYNIND